MRCTCWPGSTPTGMVQHAKYDLQYKHTASSSIRDTEEGCHVVRAVPVGLLRPYILCWYY